MKAFLNRIWQLSDVSQTAAGCLLDTIMCWRRQGRSHLRVVNLAERARNPLLFQKKTPYRTNYGDEFACLNKPKTIHVR